MLAFAVMIISTVVGAGFATGAELMAFFGDSTLPPIVIATAVGVFLFAIMVVIAFNQHRTPPNWLISAISFIFLVAMIAGVSELSGPVTAAVATLLCVVVIWLGFEKAVTINKYIMGFALAVLFVVAIANFGETMARTNLKHNIFSTIWMTVLYASMNSFMLFAVFRTALQKRTRKEVLAAGGFAALVISFFILIILTAVRANNLNNAVMPVLELGKSWFVWLAILMCIVTSLYFAMLGTTAGENRQNKVTKKLIVICGLAFTFSFMGFKKVIGVFYPIVGIAIIVYVLFVCFLWLKDYFALRHIRQH